jgi:hypothetical protein
MVEQQEMVEVVDQDSKHRLLVELAEPQVEIQVELEITLTVMVELEEQVQRVEDLEQI